jgi:hypothetical protein
LSKLSIQAPPRPEIRGITLNLTSITSFWAPRRTLLRVELHYFYRPLSLTQAGGSNTTWLSENAQLALLYGSLIEAYIFMKGEPDIMQQYEKRFAEAITGLKMFGEAKEVTDEYRTGMVIRPKQ